MTPKALSREIKFRCFYSNKMYYALPAIAFNEQGVKRIDLNNDDNDFDSTPDTWVLRKEGINLMQYTGLLDKNGKEIYEGDIVRVITDLEEGAELLMKVEWENGAFILYGYGWAIILCEEERYRELEIISNIYENPELLTKENK